jgi:hypothetical protein
MYPTVAHAPPVTAETSSDGWMGWMMMNSSPATMAARPAARASFDVVIVMSLPLF